ncbi:EscU/YscU/HrcU family type III secretion system export apparatus switch protein [Paraburkholderia sediminicola]|uniref:EscU/YscU/HrcU family type III secretion system export apparatus switch protein n=1 Tax=Paraburkholderia sediminicola TaxID=458836 RepID=UPI0038BAB116
MSEKTEAATPKRVRDARNQGQVAKSTEAVSYAQLAVTFAYVSWKGRELVTGMGNLVSRSLDAVVHPGPDNLSGTAYLLVQIVVAFVAPLAGLLLITTIFANIVQTGPLLASEALAFKPEKLNPVDNLQNLFSVSTLVQVAKSIATLAVLVVLLVSVIKGQLRSLQALPVCGDVCAPSLLASLLHSIFVATLIFGIVLSLADFGYQKYKTTEDMKMTKDEVKRENKDDEGDPDIKRRRREIQNELRSGNLSETVKRSSVVVRNPTHLAVCLYYKNGETPVPKVLMKARDLLAQRIVSIAIDARIPVVEDVELARALFVVRDGRYIPTSLYGPVALLLEALRRVEVKEEQQRNTIGSNPEQSPPENPRNRPPEGKG